MGAGHFVPDTSTRRCRSSASTILGGNYPRRRLRECLGVVLAISLFPLPGPEFTRLWTVLLRRAAYGCWSTRRRSASASMIRPARSSCLQALGLRPASLASPLIPSGRALMQLRVPAVRRNLKVGGGVPLRLGLGAPVGGERRAGEDIIDHLGHLTPRRPGRRAQPSNAACASMLSRWTKTAMARSSSDRCSTAACSWAAGRPVTRALSQRQRAGSRLAEPAWACRAAVSLSSHSLGAVT